MAVYSLAGNSSGILIDVVPSKCVCGDETGELDLEE